MSEKEVMQQEYTKDGNQNPTKLFVGDPTTTAKAICDPLLGKTIMNQGLVCIDNYSKIIKFGKLLLTKIVNQTNKQALAAFCFLLKKSSRFYAPAVEKLRANPFIQRLFNSNQANMEALAKELEMTKDDTIFRAVDTFLSETVPSSQDHVQAVRRVLYDNQVASDVNFDLVREDLSDSYHSFSLFKEASRHLFLGFTNLQQHLTEETNSSLIKSFHQLFAWLHNQVDITQYLLNTFFRIEGEIRKTTIIAQKQKASGSSKGVEKIISSQKVTSPQIKPHKISGAKEVQTQKNNNVPSQKKARQSSQSLFDSSLLKMFKKFFYKQEIKNKDDDEERQNLLFDKDYKKEK